MALSSSCSKDTKKSSLEPPNQSEQQTSKLPWQHASSFGSSWAVDDFLQFSDIEESTDKVIRSFCMDSKVPNILFANNTVFKMDEKVGRKWVFLPLRSLCNGIWYMVYGSS